MEANELGECHPHASLRPVHTGVKEDGVAINSIIVLRNLGGHQGDIRGY